MPYFRTVFSSRFAVVFLFVALAVFEYKESGNFGVSGGLFFVIFCFWIIKDFVSAAKKYSENERQLSALKKQKRDSLQSEKEKPFYLSDTAPAGINPETGLPMANKFVDVGGNHFGLSD